MSRFAGFPLLVGLLVHAYACGGTSPTQAPGPRVDTALLAPAQTSAPPAASQLEKSDTPAMIPAERYKLGDWYLGTDLGTLAASRPQLWSERRFDAGGRDRRAMTIHAPHDATDRWVLA